ncbi:glycosyl hydrolase family 18 protein [Psychromonas ossibalaenae]|uniref:glycosyl hydrolase family 18 protein n=1 Tax=Psychromonas ossibalaenae TaxID=444922 RepID=UPI00036F7C71|nr:glycosyl hydrolase family 18 protein [Psychromonas ossibalaenae]
MLNKKHKLAIVSAFVMSTLGTAQFAMAESITGNSQSNTGNSLFKINSTNYAKYSNSYKKNEDLPKVSAYLSNWTQYTQGFEPNLEELAKNDVVLLSFFGLCGTELGDPTVPSGIQGIKMACNKFGLKKYELTSTDFYADLHKPFLDQTYNEADWLDPNPNGMLGVMKSLHEEKGTRIGISIFGWSLSNVASQAVQPKNRQIFLDSLIGFVKAYPFIGQLDIDWEYPGIKGAELNVFDPINDARNYAEFVAELRQALNKIDRSDVKIAIASGAPHDKIDAAKLDNLVDAGVDTIHLMTYDFFGQWDATLNHHTNLYSSAEGKWSADHAIQYMIHDLGIPSQNIQLGYANYTRNAIATGEVQPSPLLGSFTPNPRTAGTFESASSQINDVVANYLDVDENTKLAGKNGYKLYTDKLANADFLYNDSNNLFLSLDTPRTVYTKAQYVLKHNLGGIFNWMGDPDEGLMLNAAREGLGYEVDKQAFDMTNIIASCGVNITEAECSELTFDDQRPMIIISDQQGVFVLEGNYDLAAKVSGIEPADIKSTTWTVVSADGIDKNVVAIKDGNNLDTTFSIDVAEEPAAHLNITFKLTVELNEGDNVSDTLDYTLKVNESVPEISDITYSEKYYFADLDKEFSFTANAADKADENLEYQWTTSSEYAEIIDGTDLQSQLVIDTSSLVNKPEYHVTADVTVTNKFGNTDTMSATTTVIGDADLNKAPVSSFQVLTDTPEAGATVEMRSTSTDELVDELIHEWQVTFEGEEVLVSDTRVVMATFDADEAGEYQATLKVTDVFGVENTISQTITVTEVETTWDAETVYNANDTVVYKSVPYKAKYWTKGDVPGEADVWESLEEDDGEAKEWSATKTYNTGDSVTYVTEDSRQTQSTKFAVGDTFTAKYWTKGDVPGKADVWEAFDDGSTKEWSASKVYNSGDQALYNGVTYTAKWWIQGERPDQSAAWEEAK